MPPHSSTDSSGSIRHDISDSSTRIPDTTAFSAPGKKWPHVPQVRHGRSRADMPFITPQQLSAHDKADDCWVAIEGEVYNVTPFLHRHPGGEYILYQYGGREVTQEFHAFHVHNNEKVQSRIKVLRQSMHVGTLVEDPAEGQSWSQRYGALDAEFDSLKRKLREEQWYRTDYVWFAKKLVFVASLFVSVFVLMELSERYEWPLWPIAAIVFGLFIQQSGLIAHDLKHGSIFHDRKWDRSLGWLFGNVLFGIEADWWAFEHNLHHAYCNRIDSQTGAILDPQQNNRPNFAQHPRLVPYVMRDDSLVEKAFVKVQHWTFVPLAWGAGRIAILTLCLKVMIQRNIQSVIGYAGMAAFYSGIVMIHNAYFPAWSGDWGDSIHWLVCMSLTFLTVGILHIQLELNHYGMDMYDLDEIKSMHWVEFQLKCSRNIRCPEWLDWFHGGLNMQNEHHLFPRLPRHRLRELSKIVKPLCARHKMPYHCVGFFEALTQVLSLMKDVADKITFSGRSNGVSSSTPRM